ncbi:MAG: M48 family metalloprotease [Mariprofundus sp.]|nr:M48 family metalloprotease [Mariprofundus sp.]
MYAALIGHEIAHHIKKHKSADALMNKMLFDYDQETEADELGLQLMYQAGYPLDGAIVFYQKLSQSRGHHVSFLSTHPRGEERLEHIKAVIFSIIQK